ncbi:MAG: response regulator [Bacteroidota bacterium]
MNAPVILIVDDEKNIRETIGRALETSAQRIEYAATAESALAVLAEKGIDVVFLDLKLPDRNGMEVLRTAHLAHPDLIIIIMTAYGDVESAVEAMKFGAWDFLRKPFSPDALRQSLRAALTAKAQRADPIDSAQHLDRARAFIRTVSLLAAEEELRAALANDPMNAEAYNLLGAIREIDGETMDAQVFYRIASVVDIQYLPARANLDRIASWPRTGAIDFGTEGADHVSHD